MRRFVPWLLEQTHVGPHTTAFRQAGGVAPQPAALAVAMRHIAAQSERSSTERGEEKVQPPLQSSLCLD